MQNLNVEEYFKEYFRQLTESYPKNLNIGNTLTVGIRYVDSNGKVGKMIKVCEITKEDINAKS